MLGHEVIRRFSRQYDVHATARDPRAAQRYGLPATLHFLEASDPSALVGLLDRVAPRLIVNCVGIVKQLNEGSQAIPTITVNALFPHQVAEASANAGVRLIHISTDCVFSGDLPAGRSYTEDDLPDARDLYGRTKQLGEVDSPALTVRTSIIGRELTRSTGLLEWFVAQRGGRARGFRHALFSGLTTLALADVVLELSLRYPELAGLYHVSSDSISKLDLMRMIDERLELGIDIAPVDDPIVNRTLDSSRFRTATDIPIPSWDEMLDTYLTP